MELVCSVHLGSLASDSFSGREITTEGPMDCQELDEVSMFIAETRKENVEKFPPCIQLYVAIYFTSFSLDCITIHFAPSPEEELPQFTL